MTEENRNILIVDDEEVVRNVCRRSLEKKGYRVEVAEHGVHALDQLRQKEFALVFTDLRMPIMDGLELLETIKRDYGHVEVIIMTAYATLESAIDAMKTGANDFLLKPVKPDQIRLVAEKCFDKIQLDEENKALKLANEKLKEIQEMKDKFLAITSHELRTPVSHLKGYLGIINSDYFHQISDEEKQQCMKVLSEASDNLEEIVTNMHELIHLENREWELQNEHFDLNDMTEEIVRNFTLIAKKRNQKIQFAKCAEKLPLFSDSKQIKSVINELIQNAVKFTPDAGEIKVSTNLDEDFCVVKVKDNGIGIKQEDQGKIFEKFYEVQNSDYHSTSKEAFMGGGLGIGLPVAQAIARAHGGGVKVKSRLDEGSEFLLYLPKQLN